MQGRIRRHYATEVVVEYREDVVRYLCVHGIWPWTCPLQFVTGVIPEGQIRIGVIPVLFRWDKTSGGVVELSLQVIRDVGAERVRF